MATERTISSLSFPCHLATPNWNDQHYRTSVASCLVEVVYKMAVGLESEAKFWYERLNFTLFDTLIDKCDNKSIYAAIFEYNNYNTYQNISGLRPPRFVIAFRGTILKDGFWCCDLRSCLRCIFGTLHDSRTAMHAVEATYDMVVGDKSSSVWLAGHSLGGARALLVGKTMARHGFCLESYIFNPPISCFPLEQVIKFEKLRDGIRVIKCLFKATVASIFKDLEVQEDDDRLRSWIPYIFVNRADGICSEYIGHFENKKVMANKRLSEIERIASKYPLRSLLFETESLHLLPSAHLIVNPKKSKDLEEAHTLNQWFDASFKGEYVLYQS